MKRSLHIRKIRRRLFCRKGHGVHSPFVFNLITQVIEEKLPFYAFDEIKQTASSDSRFTHRYGQLLFRLVNHFKPNVVIRVGSPAVPDLYLQKALSGKGELHLINTPDKATGLEKVDLLIADCFIGIPDEEVIDWLVENKAILIISNIHKDEKQREVWQYIINSLKTRIRIDTWNVGIAFFEQKLHRKLYKTYFNYGKK